MKAVKSFLVFALLPMFVMAFATPKDLTKKDPSEELRTKVTKLIGTPDLRTVPEYDRKASIKFIVTTENELLVINVDTKHDRIEDHVKSSINYKEFKVRGIQKMQAYQVDVSFEEN